MQSVKYLGLVAFSALALQVTNAHAEDQRRKKKKDTEKPVVVVEPDTLIAPIPNNRWLFANNVTKSIRGIDARDGQVDQIVYDPDPVVSKVLTQTFLVDAQKTLIKIENSKADHVKKIRYHRALTELLDDFKKYTGSVADPLYYRRLLKNFEDLMYADINGNVMNFVKANANVYTLENIGLVEGNPEAKAYIFEAVGKEKPEMMIKRLPQFAKESYADPIVAAAAKVVPGTILTYAQSNSSLSSVIRRNTTP